MSEKHKSKSLSFEESKALILKAKEDFSLSNKELSAILTPTPNGYQTYKKWITDGMSSRQVPSSSVLAHIETLYEMYRKSPEKTRQRLKVRAEEKIKEFLHES